MLSIYLTYTPHHLYKVGCAIYLVYTLYIPSICLAHTPLISHLTTAIYSYGYMYILSICIAYSVHKVAKATDARSVWLKVWPRRPFSVAPSVTPSNFSVTPASCTPAKVLRKSKLSEPPARRHLFYKNAFITTKNKSYFIKLVNRTVK